MSIKSDFYAACVNTNTAQELRDIMASDDLGFHHETAVANGWSGLTFDDYIAAIKEAIGELSIEE